MKATLMTTLAMAALLAASPAGAAEKKKGDDGAKTIAYLGVATEAVDPAVARHLKLRPGEGLEVRMVDEDSPAAGQIREDDILKELNGQWLVNPEQLRTVVRMMKPGDEVSLTLIREGEARKVPLKLGSREISREELMQERMAGRGPQGYSEEELMPFFRQFRNQAPWGGMGRNPHWNGPDADDDAGAEVEKPSAGGRPETHVSSSSSYTEGDTTATLTQKDDDKHLKVTKGGKTLFDGPVNTEKQIDQLPKDVRSLYDKVAKSGATIKLKTQTRADKSGSVDI